MSSQSHQRVRQLFDEALERPEPERLPFLQAACDGDTDTFDAVLQLLKARGEAQAFLETQSPTARLIGRYVVRGELGRGAMGIVYEAMDPMIGRSVAIKVILFQSPDDTRGSLMMRERLFREARSAGLLSHPGIVTIFDVGQEGDTAFIAMELVRGSSLQEILATGARFNGAEAIDILKQTAAALDYAHQNGVVHRDVKPANIMLHKGTTVKVADFGIAKIVSGTALTRTGLWLGTPAYMSPEQSQGLPVDGRSDQFSLAILAYEMMTGTKPFQADSVPAMVHLIVYGPRPSARAVNPSLPAAVDEVFRCAMAELPEERYANCMEFVTFLERALGVGPVPDAGALAAARSKKHRLAYLAGGATLAAVAALVLIVPRYTSSKVPRAGIATPSTLPVAKRAPSSPPPGPVEVTSSKAPVVAAPKRSAAEGPPDAHQLYTDAAAKRSAGQIAAAVPKLRQAASLGDTRAMVDLGEILLDGEGDTTKDENEAVRWFRKAADKGNPSGMVHLGLAYFQNEHYDEAAYWCRKAADAGNSAAMFDLAEMYKDGLGVPKDLEKAKRLYTRAAGLGDGEAKKRLAELNKNQ